MVVGWEDRAAAAVMVDGEVEGFDLVGEAPGVGFGAPALEPVLTEVLVDDVVVEDVPAGNEGRVGDGFVPSLSRELVNGRRHPWTFTAKSL